jgi:uncharacterized phage protein (TIGR02220 family)
MEESLIKRTKKKGDFTQIENSLLNDKRMSLDTKGLLCYILSKPDDWITYKRQLMKEFSLGRTSIDRMFKEMEVCGYVVVSKMVRGADGSFKGNAYHFYDESILKETNLTDARLPTTDDPSTDNHTTTNTILKPILNYTNISIVVLEVVELLNRLTGKNYRPTKDSSTYNFISARLNDGYSVEQLKSVIEYKVNQWSKDDFMKKYLRPETLFNKTKFESYVNEIPSNKEVKQDGQTDILEQLKQNWKNYNG